MTLCPACGEVTGQEPEITEAAAAEEVAVTEEVAATAEAPEITEEAELPVSEEVQEEAAPAPKKGINVKAIVAIGCCVALLLGLVAVVFFGMSGAGDSESGVLLKESYSVTDEAAAAAANKVAAQVGDQKLTNGQLQIFYWGQVYDFLSNNSYYLSYIGLDYTQPLDEQYYSEEDGMTWQHYFLDNSIAIWNRYQLLCMMAQEDGFTLDEETQSYLDNLDASLEEMAEAYEMESVEALIQGDFGAGCSLEDYRNYLTMYYLGYGYFYQEFEAMNPTDDEVKAYFDENYEEFEAQGLTEDAGSLVDVRHILIQPEGCEFDDYGYVVATDEQWEACRQEAQAMLDDWLSGGASEDAFAALANEHSVDGGSNTNGGLYTEVMSGDMVEAFDAWCFDESRQSGDSGLVKTEFGYHIMYFVDSEEIWYTYAKSTLISDLMNQRIEDYAAEHEMTVNYKNIALGVIDLAG